VFSPNGRKGTAYLHLGAISCDYTLKTRGASVGVRGGRERCTDYCYTRFSLTYLSVAVHNTSESPTYFRCYSSTLA
jgi:hypothetical protein